MSTLGWIITGLLTLIVGGIGMMKLLRLPVAIEQAERLGYRRLFMPIGIAEVSVVVALILGAAISDLEWLGTLAAYGLIGMMIGASWLHHRAGDTFERLPAVVVTLLSIGYLTQIGG